MTALDELQDIRATLPDNNIADMAGWLNDRLAECLDLSLQARYARWNVSGQNSVPLRELFNRLHEDLDRLAESLAGRIIQLGAIAESNFFSVRSGSNLTVFPRSMEGSIHVQCIATSLAKWRSLLRLSIARASQLSDSATAEVLTDASRAIDQWSLYVGPYLETA